MHYSRERTLADGDNDDDGDDDNDDDNDDLKDKKVEEEEERNNDYDNNDGDPLNSSGEEMGEVQQQAYFQRGN